MIRTKAYTFEFGLRSGNDLNTELETFMTNVMAGLHDKPGLVVDFVPGPSDPEVWRLVMIATFEAESKRDGRPRNH